MLYVVEFDPLYLFAGQSISVNEKKNMHLSLHLNCNQLLSFKINRFHKVLQVSMIPMYVQEVHFV